MNNRKGQAITEFALVFPVFMMLLCGVMQIAYIAVCGIIVNHAAFEVTRVGVLTDDFQKMMDMAYNAIPFSNKKDISLDVISKPEDFELKIRLGYKVPLMFPFINIFLKKALNLQDMSFPLQTVYLLPKESMLN